nr:RNA-directed DNA polymerase, eukaryota, reverse transcriptase zinc-binding domain protein [Tanacetum cinerariifolium]
MQDFIDCTNEAEPHNKDLKEKEVHALDVYNKAIDEEESFLFQKEKVDWINMGDRNNQYFHKIIKSRRQVNKIASICDNDGNRMEGNLMKEQFVNHFRKFLGANKVIIDVTVGA